MKANQKVNGYVEAAPPDQQPLLKWVRKLMRTHLDGTAEECCEPGMVVHEREGKWLAGFASRKKDVMFYVMDSPLLDRYAGRLGKLRSGKSCIEFKETPSLALAGLKALGVELLREVRKRQ